MKIEIVKQFKLLEVGKQLDIDAEYAKNLIKKGFAKSLEVEIQPETAEEIPELIEKLKVKAVKAKKQ